MYVYVVECKTSDPWYGYNLIGLARELEGAKSLAEEMYSDEQIRWNEGFYTHFNTDLTQEELICWYARSEPDEDGWEYFDKDEVRIRTMKVKVY